VEGLQRMVEVNVSDERRKIINEMIDRVGARRADLVESFIQANDSVKDKEERWMFVAAIHAYFETWGEGCSDRDAYRRMMDLWRPE